MVDRAGRSEKYTKFIEEVDSILRKLVGNGVKNIDVKDLE